MSIPRLQVGGRLRSETFGVERHASEAFQGVGGGEMCARFVGDRERFVGVTCGLIIVALCNTNAGARR